MYRTSISEVTESVAGWDSHFLERPSETRRRSYRSRPRIRGKLQTTRAAKFGLADWSNAKLFGIRWCCYVEAMDGIERV